MKDGMFAAVGAALCLVTACRPALAEKRNRDLHGHANRGGYRQSCDRFRSGSISSWAHDGHMKPSAPVGSP
jgi:hypothetical protein